MRATEPTSVAAALLALLESLGFRRAYGVTGGPIAPICHELGRSSIRALHCRHESGAAFAALEDSLASGAPAVVFVTTGPGITNALTGMCAARWEGGRVLLVSGSTSRREVGRRAFQETSSETLPQAGLFGPGPIFDDAWRLDRPSELAAIGAAIARGLTRPQGWVGHLSVPISVQTEPCDSLPRFESHVEPGPIDLALADRCAELLARRSFAIWAGFGARGAAAEVRRLAERTGAPVMCSPRGKGVFPEDHAQYLGVTGFGGHPDVKEYLSVSPPEHILVLGSRLGEFTSFWDPAFVPPGGFVHVDLDPAVPGASFPDANTIAVQADVRGFLRALLERIPERPGRPVWSAPERSPAPAQRALGLIRPEVLLDSLQRCVVERCAAPILTDAGNAFAWGSHSLRFPAPRYRTSTGWGAMGHATSGVIGAANGRGGVAVALVGDGSMLMQSEVSTAVRYGIPAAWVVLNDGAYGMIQQGMTAQGLRPLETELPRTDFAAWAESLGAEGVRIASEVELDKTLSRIESLVAPLVVDVRVDPSEPAPFLKRVQSLIRQTTHTKLEVQS